MPGAAEAADTGGLLIGKNDGAVRSAGASQPSGLRHGGAEGREIMKLVLRAQGAQQFDIERHNGKPRQLG